MSSENDVMTADEFLSSRFDLPESGQWSELEEGVAVHLQPPDLDHGNTILNLSKQLAQYASESSGYPCFDLGLLLTRNPDTIRFPAVSYFLEGERFAETDRVATDTVPGLVIELASTADRRKKMAAKTAQYLKWGVRSVWVIDPAEATLETIDAASPDLPQTFSASDEYADLGLLEGFHLQIEHLFVEPSWWS